MTVHRRAPVIRRVQGQGQGARRRRPRSLKQQARKGLNHFMNWLRMKVTVRPRQQQRTHGTPRVIIEDTGAKHSTFSLRKEGRRLDSKQQADFLRTAFWEPGVERYTPREPGKGSATILVLRMTLNSPPTVQNTAPSPSWICLVTMMHWVSLDCDNQSFGRRQQ